jgi:hypothetical protein
MNWKEKRENNLFGRAAPEWLQGTPTNLSPGKHGIKSGGVGEGARKYPKAMMQQKCGLTDSLSRLVQ